MYARPTATKLYGKCENCDTEITRVVGPSGDVLTEECTNCEMAAFQHTPPPIFSYFYARFVRKS